MQYFKKLVSEAGSMPRQNVGRAISPRTRFQRVQAGLKGRLRPGLAAPQVFALILCLPAFAASTRTWSETDYAEFEKGNLKNLSLRSDGVLTLAPKFQELYDSSSAYLWTLARDSKGNLYTGGGPGAKLYRLTPKGEKKTLAELDGL